MNSDLGDEGNMENRRIDYWGSLDNIHVPTLKRKMTEFFSKQENIKIYQEWISKHGPYILEDYIKALQSGRAEAMITSCHDFSMYCFSAITMGSGMKRSGTTTQPKPQTTEQQKVVKEKLSDDNISQGVEDLCKELGIFTSDEEPPENLDQI